MNVACEFKIIFLREEFEIYPHVLFLDHVALCCYHLVFRPHVLLHRELRKGNFHDV